MAFLEIIHISGEVDQKKLSKQQPLTIGSHASTDITIDEDNVEIMHCRISWGKGGFEAVAAGTEAIEVNGNLVQRAVLKAGDTLRFGSVDIRYRDSNKDGHAPVADEENQSELGLKPLSEELPAPRTPPQKASPEVDEINEDDLIDDDLELIDEEDDDEDASSGGGDLSAGLAALAAAESREGGKSAKKKKSKPQSKPKQKPKSESPPSIPANQSGAPAE